MMASGRDRGKHWAGIREGGTLFGLQAALWLHRHIGRGFFVFIGYPVACYFILFKPTFRRASREYLDNHYRCYPEQWKRPPGLRHVMRHFLTFGRAILDKCEAWMSPVSADEFHIATPGVCEELRADPRGQLIIGSHFGNLEFCRGFIQQESGKTINVLLYDRHAENFVALMKRINPQSRLNVYQTDQLDIGTTLALKTKIDKGEWLFIAGDRIPVTGHQRTEAVSFLGKGAPFPIGPYMLGKALECPVKLMFAYRQGEKVRFEVQPFAERIELPRARRREELRRYTQEYAAILEQHCARAPYHWFNFYPFWEGDTPRHG